MTNNGSTPMSTIKILLSFAALPVMLILVYVAFFMPHGTAPPDNTQINYVPTINAAISPDMSRAVSYTDMGGKVRVQIAPIIEAGAVSVPTSTPTPRPPTPTPTLAPTIPPTPTPRIIGVNDGAVIYTPTPMPTEKPTLYENPQYIDRWNMVECNNLNIGYVLKKNIALKKNAPLSIDVSMANLMPGSITHVSAILSIIMIDEGPQHSNNVILYTQDIANEDVTLEQYDSYKLNYKGVVPNFAGHYGIVVSIITNNGATAKIWQEVTIT
jgi:hypothetical protein